MQASEEASFEGEAGLEGHALEVPRVPAWVTALLGQVNQRLEGAPPEEILAWGFETFGPSMTMGTAFGASGMVLLDMARRVCPDLDIFYVDTGLFFPETYQLIERAQQLVGRPFRRVSSQLTVEQQARVCGDDLWKRDPDRCCHLRKVLPLALALQGRAAWVTAVRRDQASTRRATPAVSWNAKHGLVKLAPLARWTEKEVWTYLHDHDLPYNALHDQGYPSIGCEPCTQPAWGSDDLRAGRWAGTAKVECGIHL